MEKRKFFKIINICYLIHTKSDKALKGTFVYQELPFLHNITLTVLLNAEKQIFLKQIMNKYKYY